MRVRLDYAALSFCPDLTDPKAQSVPLGVVGAGRAGARGRFWFFVLKNPPWLEADIQSDPTAQAILSELPLLLRKQVTEGVTRQKIESFLTWLHDRFRNSVHVENLQCTSFAVRSKNPQKEVVDHCIELYRRMMSYGKPKRKIPQESMPEIGFQPLPQEAGDLVTA